MNIHMKINFCFKVAYISLMILITGENSAQANNSINSFSPETSIPSSPETALLLRFGQTPVNYHNGTANISIPLYSVKSGNHQLPLTLSYHSSGIKVEDEATWVGLGWNFQPEATIFQEVRGMRDGPGGDTGISVYANDMVTFKQNHLPPISIDTYYSTYQIGKETGAGECMETPSGYSTQGYIIQQLEQGKWQPDIFHFNLGQYSGKFFLHPETTVPILLESDAEIKFSSNIAGLNSFSLTTPDGTVYTFGTNGVEEAHRNGMADVSGYTFKVTQIMYLDGKSFTFSYEDEQTLVFNYSESSFVNDAIYHQPTQSTVDWTVQNKKRLSQIRSAEEIVDLVFENREDLIPGSQQPAPKRLKGLLVSSPVTSAPIKGFDFSYSYFVAGPSGGTANLLYPIANNSTTLTKRLKLESIREVGYVNGQPDTSQPPYVFTYNTTALPSKHSFSKDLWGYFNGRDNSSPLPNLRPFGYEKQNVYLLGHVYNPTYFSYPYTGSNRYTDNLYVQAGILTGIKYPTGGSTEFTYESNVFENQFIFNAQQLIDGNNSRSALTDLNYPTEQYSAVFQLHEATTLKIALTYSAGVQGAAHNFALTQFWNGATIMLVTKVGSIETTIKEWRLKELQPSFQTFESTGLYMTNVEHTISSTNPATNYYLKVIRPLISPYNFPSPYSHNVKADLSYFSTYGMDQSKSIMGGVRIAEIKNFSSTNVLASRKKLKYFGGKLLNKFNPLQISFVNNKTGQGTTNGVGVEYIGFHKRIFISSSDLGMGGDAAVGYDRVEEEEIGEANATNGKTIYSFYNTESYITNSGLPFIRNVWNGKLASKKLKDKNDQDIQTTNYGYQDISTLPNYYSLIIKRLAVGALTPCRWNANYSNGTNIQIFYPTYGPVSGSMNEFVSCALNPSRIIQSSETTTQNFPGDVVTNSSAMQYNENGTLKSRTMTSSIGETLLEKYFYASDTPFLQPVEATMIASNAISLPLKKESYRGSDLIASERMEYVSDGSTNFLILPKRFYSAKGNANLELKMTFDKYSPRGNIRQFTPTGGVTTSFIWGYSDTKLLARVNNYEYDAISVSIRNNLNTYSSTNYSEVNLRNELTNLRASLPTAMVTTYIYTPGVGVKAITDPKGDFSTYIYDSFSRLKEVRDKDGKILSESEYNYRPN
ncbi:hypothetical protein [Flavobacterium sp.]|uniref:hypothetical protein n=1 Tax=Flavobacterium sp. TaxID=239 RepID=UPI0012028513|nr:hypothetical protein [Flavobacterium sp.]RZJ72574.1 MAG: hypothetical protein EOO49_06590 [Flavobacterium sp.]